jgi:hypothetical protein
MVPALDFWDAVIPGHPPAVFHEDNQACIRVLETGRNPTMRHLDRCHRVSVAGLHERLGNPETKDNVEVVYTDSSVMAADIYTKAFTDPEKWERVCQLVNVMDPAQLDSMIKTNGPVMIPRPVKGEVAEE